MGNLKLRLKKESLEKELATYQKNYEDVFRKYDREQNPANKNSWKDQLDEYLEKIARIEQEIKSLDNCQTNETICDIIKILECHFTQNQSNIFYAYELALPNRFVKNSRPQNVSELINILLLPNTENSANYLERFIGFLLLNQKTSTELKINLKKWAEENIANCEQLLQRLQQEKHDREQKCNPSLLVAISSSGDSYVVEAWLIKNLDQYNRECYSDCEQLKINNKVQIATDANLTNVPEIIKILLEQSFKKIQKYLKQIHIFLPSNLLNHGVDCWDNWQEANDDDYATTIGEDYEVIIRCSERLRGKSPPVYKWHDKGDIFIHNLENPAIDILTLGDTNNSKDLFKKVKHDQVKAVKITKVFQKQEPGKLLCHAGIPLALWIRQQFDNIKEELDNLLQDNEQNILLKQLPYQVKIKRGEDTEISEHLCLLWDDPKFLPPEQLLTEIKL
jgi:hypothetical protein